MPLTLEEKKAHSARVAVVRRKLKEIFKLAKVQKSTGVSKDPWVQAHLPSGQETKFPLEFAERCTRTIYGDNESISGYCGNVGEYRICMNLSEWEQLLTYHIPERAFELKRTSLTAITTLPENTCLKSTN